LTGSAYGAFGMIKDLFIIVKVGARSPRPHLVGVFSDRLLDFHFFSKKTFHNFAIYDINRILFKRRKHE
jgi:hypothetical protein